MTSFPWPTILPTIKEIKSTAKGDQIDAFSNDIFFNSYKPKKGDVCIDIGAGLGIDTRLMSRMVENEGKVFSIEATERTYKALEACV